MRREWLAKVVKAGPVLGLGALLVGIGLGSLYPAQLAWLGAGVKAAFGGLAKAAPYIIFFTLVPSILGMLQTGSAARFALWASVAFVLATAVSGLIAVLALTLVFQLEFAAGGADVGAAFASVLDQTLLLAHTSPPFIAIWYGTLVALGLHFGARTKAMGWICGPTAEVLTKVGVDGVEWLGKGIRVAFPVILFSIGVFIPTGVADAIRAGRQTIDDAGGLAAIGGANPVAWYFLSVGVLVGVLAVLVVGATAAICWYTGFSFRAFFRDYFAFVYPFAWATASSAATIPVNLERAKNGLKVRKEVRDFIIPLGATVNLDGTMVGAFVLTVVGGILVGYKPTVVDLLVLVIPLTVVSVGVPGIPGGMAAVAPPVIVSILPIPLAGQVAFIAIFFAFAVGLSDQFRTGVNSCNNGLLCLLFEHWYPTKFEKPAYEVIATSERAPVPEGAEAPKAPEPLPEERA